MKPEADFVIDKVGWHTRVRGNPESREHVLERFFVLLEFLRSNHLLVREPDGALDAMNDEYSVRSSDLTAEGLEVMKAGYDKWLRALDAGKSPLDVTTLRRALKRIREK